MSFFRSELARLTLTKEQFEALSPDEKEKLYKDLDELEASVNIMAKTLGIDTESK